MCVCVSVLINLSRSLGVCGFVFACLQLCCISTIAQYVSKYTTACDKDGLLVHLLLRNCIGPYSVITVPSSHFSLCLCVRAHL